MATQKAIVHVSKDVTELRDNVAIPTLPGDDWLLIAPKAVALNPTDYKNVQNVPVPGAITGCDYAGVVEKVGSAVEGVKVGDRIAGFVRGGDPNDQLNGAFAQHIKAKIGINTLLPPTLSFTDAATLGVGITTVGQFYQVTGLPLPPSTISPTHPTSVLVYGGATATGTLAIQLLKLSGLRVFATSSPKNFDLLRSLGADEVFDYHAADVGQQIRAASQDGLQLAYDCIGTGNVPAVCADALSSRGGGTYVSLLRIPRESFPRSDVKIHTPIAYTALGADFLDRPASPEDEAFGIKVWKVVGELLRSGKLKTHPTEVREGLEGIPQGLIDLKEGKVSGVKLVYTVE